MHLLSGTLNLSGTGTSTADFTTDLGTTLNYSTGPHTQSGTYTFDGDVHLLSGTLNLSGTGTSTADVTIGRATRRDGSARPVRPSGPYMSHGGVAVRTS